MQPHRPLNQQVGRFLRKQAQCEATWQNTPEGKRAYQRYDSLMTLAEIFYSYRDQREDDEQAAFDELTEQDFEDYAFGRRS